MRPMPEGRPNHASGACDSPHARDPAPTAEDAHGGGDHRDGPRRRAGDCDQDAVQVPTVGAEELPFFWTVKPKLVEAPAARSAL